MEESEMESSEATEAGNVSKATDLLSVEHSSTEPLAVESSPVAQLTEQIESQVSALEEDVEQVDDSEVQQRVEHLIGLIKTHLRSQTLSPKIQKELARLLSLTPNLNHHHIQQLNLLDLAVSTLLDADASASQKGLAESKNLVFVQETRRQIAHQSRRYPDVLRAIITGNGTPYIRLISGLSWFFFIFVIAPLTLSGAIFLVREAARDVADYAEAKARAEALTIANQQLQAQSETDQSRIEALENRQNALVAQLGSTGSQLLTLSEQGTAIAANSAANSEAQTNGAIDTPKQVVVALGDLEDIRRQINTELRASAAAQNAAAQSLEPEPTDSPVLEEREERTRPERQAQRQAERQETLAPGASSLPEQVIDVTTNTITAADDVLSTRFSLILLAISMGALGSTISVIVRANIFIQQAQESENDLFLTGFFRPFVGMSFAIFCVALVEAGIFSGLFDISNRKEADRVYFYVVIAFVAGFSERLVRDVVIKTEDTLAGPKTRD